MADKKHPEQKGADPDNPHQRLDYLDPVDFLDVLSFEVAIADAEQAAHLPETPAERVAIDRMDRAARGLIQELRQRAFEEIQRRQPEPRRR